MLSDFEVLADRLFRNYAIVFALAFGYTLNATSKDSKTFLYISAIIILNIIPYFTDAGPYILIK